MQRAIEEPIEIMNLNLDSQVPSEIKKCWASSINKKTLILPEAFFITEAKEAQENIVLSGYITDNDSFFDGLETINDWINQRADLNCMNEEADS